MYADERFKKATKCYVDFPFLWAIVPHITSDLDIQVKPLDGALVSANVAENTRWWIRFNYASLMSEVREVKEIENNNLAAEILAALGEILTPAWMDILYLVSLEKTRGFQRIITVYRPPRENFTLVPILGMCQSRAFTAKAA